MEKLTLTHFSGQRNFSLVGKTLTITDGLIHETATHEFTSSKEAMRFIGEYLISFNGPTEEFQQLFPTLI